jgi:5,10-methylenetetrahydromethanopterin reductase
MSGVEFFRHAPWTVPVADTGMAAKRCEAWGWDGFSVGESPGMGKDPFICLTLAAMATQRLKVGTTVLVPVRNPESLANSMATLHAVSGGRAIFDLGRGDSAVELFGHRPLRVEEFSVFVRQVQGYLLGEDVDRDGFTSSILRAFRVDPSLESVGKAPFVITATGPRVIEIGARYADGSSFMVGADAVRLKSCIEQARAARAEAGLDAATMLLTAHVHVAVSQNGDREAARQIIEKTVLTLSRFSAYDGKPLEGVSDAVAKGALRAVKERQGGAYAAVPESAAVDGRIDFYRGESLDEDFVDRFAIIGEAKYCAERLSEMIELGLQRVVIHTRGIGTDPQETNAGRIAQEVLPLLR